MIHRYITSAVYLHNNSAINEAGRIEVLKIVAGSHLVLAHLCGNMHYQMESHDANPVTFNTLQWWFLSALFITKVTEPLTLSSMMSTGCSKLPIRGGT